MKTPKPTYKADSKAFIINLTNCIFCLPLLIYNFLQPYFTALSCLILQKFFPERIQIPCQDLFGGLQVFFAQCLHNPLVIPGALLLTAFPGLCVILVGDAGTQAQCLFKCLLQVAVAAEAAQLAVEFQIALPVDLIVVD